MFLWDALSLLLFLCGSVAVKPLNLQEFPTLTKKTEQ